MARVETISTIETDLLTAMTKLCVRLGAERGEATISAALTAIRAARELGSPELNQPPQPGADPGDYLLETLYCPRFVH